LITLLEIVVPVVSNGISLDFPGATIRDGATGQPAHQANLAGFDIAQELRDDHGTATSTKRDNTDDDRGAR
jgi:hypothetical protein